MGYQSDYALKSCNFGHHLPNLFLFLMHFRPIDPLEGFNVIKSTKLEQDVPEEQAETDEDGTSKGKEGILWADGD